MIREYMKQQEDEAMPEREDAETPEHEQEEAPEQERSEDQSEGANQDGEITPVGRVIQAAMQVLYSPKTSPGVLKILGDRSPINGLVKATLVVMRALQEQSQTGIPLPVFVESADAVVLLLAEMAVSGGGVVDGKLIQQAQEIVRRELTQASEQGQPAQPGAPQAQAQPAGIVSGAMQGA